jgi:hypothetical protein
MINIIQVLNEKNCFVKEKGKKESLSPGACSLIRQKATE